MAHTKHLDEIIKEYLVFRGFGNTLKTFENDLKIDKDKSFRADKIIEQLLHFINNYDLISIKELWTHLENHMFSKLESHFTPGVKKLENAVYKMYLVNAVIAGKNDKVADFFAKMTPELQNQAEWKDWFMLPYIKNPEENPIFSLHFTKQWQDTCLVSLHNFLASIFQYMPTPELMHYEEVSNEIQYLQNKNDSLRRRIALLLDKGSDVSVTPCQVDPPPDMLDDFYIIAQEITSQTKSFKSIIRNIGGNSSPILGRKDTSNTGRRKTGSISKSVKPNQSFFYDP